MGDVLGVCGQVGFGLRYFWFLGGGGALDLHPAEEAGALAGSV